MSGYDDNHWDWIRGLINQTEDTNPAPQPATPPTPATTPDALAIEGDNVYAVTRHDDGLVSYQPLQGNWR